MYIEFGVTKLKKPQKDNQLFSSHKEILLFSCLVYIPNSANNNCFLATLLIILLLIKVFKLINFRVVPFS